MQFQVPQFIETEDKIVGPLSLRQFTYLAIAAGISGILLFISDFWFWVIISLPLMGVGGILAFGKLNGRPISVYFRSLFRSIWAPSVYVFRAETQSPMPMAELSKKFVSEPKKPDLGGIKNLWVKINTSSAAVPKRERALPAQGQSFSQFKEKFEAVRQMTGEREVAKRVDYR